MYIYYFYYNNTIWTTTYSKYPIQKAKFSLKSPTIYLYLFVMTLFTF